MRGSRPSLSGFQFVVDSDQPMNSAKEVLLLAAQMIYLAILSALVLGKLIDGIAVMVQR